MKANGHSEREIRARAYQIYMESGCKPGHDIDNWLQAEYELMQLPVHKIVELEPPARNRGKGGRRSLADLVRTAVVLGAEALPHLRHTGGMGS